MIPEWNAPVLAAIPFIVAFFMVRRWEKQEQGND